MKHILAFAVPLVCLVTSACRSAHVDVNVENRTGGEVRLLEVDYPNASFGANSLADGATLHYRIQVQGDGAVKVQYTLPDLKQPQITGPQLATGDNGRLEIVLQSGGKAEFHPELHAGN
jgi:hypothetical protein